MLTFLTADPISPERRSSLRRAEVYCRHVTPTSPREKEVSEKSRSILEDHVTPTSPREKEVSEKSRSILQDHVTPTSPREKEVSEKSRSILQDHVTPTSPREKEVSEKSRSILQDHVTPPAPERRSDTGVTPTLSQELTVCAKNISLTASGEKVIFDQGRRPSDPHTLSAGRRQPQHLPADLLCAGQQDSKPGLTEVSRFYVIIPHDRQAQKRKF
ncbi:hypothetical protein WMY93_000407 [Mugilogobius chulae]|uniref:Uncharacterized protein n=1 Tax=Mugilogobius chulae TaxID=88201 RepID=A0AAW0PZ79_9GOBI